MNANKKQREYEMVRMVFKKTNNKKSGLERCKIVVIQGNYAHHTQITPSGLLDNKVHPIQVKGLFSLLGSSKTK